MDQQTVGMIRMLANALGGKNRPLPEDFDWEAFRDSLAQHQKLWGLLIRGATMAGVPRSHPMVKKMMIGFLEDIRRSKNQMQQLHAVYDAFDEKGIDYMPVKGAVLKGLYPQPELRMMEDADVLIRVEQMPLIQDIMLGMQMEERRGDDNEYTWNHPKLLLELHKALLPSGFGPLSDYLKDGWVCAIKEPHGNAFKMREEDHFIFLVIHFAKHYMRGSISPKDICDFWVFRKAYPVLDEAYIEAEMEKLELTVFYRNILDILEFWFRGAEPTSAAAAMTDAVFQHGVADERTAFWSYSILSKQNKPGILGSSKFRFLLSRVFPSLAFMQNRYPILMKKPWLLPVFWFVRWFQLIFQKNGLGWASDVLLKEDVFQHYTDHLQAVGLGNRLHQ